MASDIPARAIAADGLNWAKGQVISARAENLSPSMIPYISGEDANGNLMLSFALFADLPGFTSGGGVTLPITIADVTDLQTTLDDLQSQITAIVGGGVLAYVKKTSNYTLTASDYVCAVDASGGAVTITLPSAVGIAGKVYVVKRVNTTGSNVTLATTSSQKIDGTGWTFAAGWTSLVMMSDGANWLVLARVA